MEDQLTEWRSRMMEIGKKVNKNDNHLKMFEERIKLLTSILRFKSSKGFGRDEEEQID